MSNSSENQKSVTPLGLAVAILILCLLAYLAIPRLQAVSAERTRPEAPRILSSSESAPLSAVEPNDCVCGCGGNTGLLYRPPTVYGQCV
jgi:cytochrome c-type biogenesis protein CcmH/NrfG